GAGGGGGKSVGGGGEGIGAQKIRAGALDRAGGDPIVAARSRGAGEIDEAAGIGDELGGAAVAVGGELRLCGVVGGNGRAAGGAGVGKRQREAAIVYDARISGRTCVDKCYRAVVCEARRGRGIIHNACATDLAIAADLEERTTDDEGIRRRAGVELNGANRGGGV